MEDDDELLDVKKDLPIIPNYLSNPPFPYVYNSMSNSTTSTSTSSLNGRLSPPLQNHNMDTPISLSPVQTSGTTLLQHGKASVGCDGDVTKAIAIECLEPVVQNGHAHQLSVPPSRTHCSPAGSIQPETQQPSGPYTGAVPTFQPFFFTGAIPFSNMQGNTYVEKLYGFLLSQFHKTVQKNSFFIWNFCCCCSQGKKIF